MRFNEIQRLFPDITHATLTKQLRRLEEQNVVVRKVYSQIPPKVEYSLSDVGKKLKPILDSVMVWGRNTSSSWKRTKRKYWLFISC